MVYKFRIVSDEVDNFKREIDIDADDTFLSLRNAICDSVGYDKNQMSSFFLCDNSWEKEKEITLEDMGSDSSVDAYLMEDTVISDFVEDEGQRLIFTFDYLTDRSFFMELKEVEPGVSIDAPLCTLSKGNPPAQTVNLDEFDSTIDAAAAKAAASADSDIFGDEFGDGYDDDDLAGLNDDTEF